MGVEACNPDNYAWVEFLTGIDFPGCIEEVSIADDGSIIETGKDYFGRPTTFEIDEKGKVSPKETCEYRETSTYEERDKDTGKTEQVTVYSPVCTPNGPVSFARRLLATALISSLQTKKQQEHLARFYEGALTAFSPQAYGTASNLVFNNSPLNFGLGVTLVPGLPMFPVSY